LSLVWQGHYLDEDSRQEGDPVVSGDSAEGRRRAALVFAAFL
jgi:hypothetical protein